MKITYDSSVDAAYIEFKSAKEVTTIRLTREIKGKSSVSPIFNFLLLKRIFHIRTSSILIVSVEYYFLFLKLFSFFLVATCVSR